MTKLESINGKEDKSRINIYRKILGCKIFNSLNDSDKEEIINQIDSIGVDFLHNNSIKIRVKPRMINLLRKITGVHDFRGGAYFGNAIYLSNPDDLFNKRLINHEAIHLKQQQELSPIKLIGFIKWLLIVMKDIKKFKNENGNHKYVNYEATVMIPTELESYSNERNMDYIPKRSEKQYEKDSFHKSIGRIEEGNYIEIKNELIEKYLYSQLKKLENVMDSTKNEERSMWVFNNIDKVNELEKVKKLLEIKLKILSNVKNEKLKIEFENMKKLLTWEISKFNMTYIFEDEIDGKFGNGQYKYINIEHLKEKLKWLENQIVKYRRESATIRLESKKNVNKCIQLGILKD